MEHFAINQGPHISERMQQIATDSYRFSISVTKLVWFCRAPVFFIKSVMMLTVEALSVLQWQSCTQLLAVGG